MYEVILLILAVAIVALGVRMVIKIREISSYKADERERELERKMRLPRDLQELKVDEPQIENWDSPPPTEKKAGDTGASEEKPK